MVTPEQAYAAYVAECERADRLYETYRAFAREVGRLDAAAEAARQQRQAAYDAWDRHAAVREDAWTTYQRTQDGADK